MDRQAYYECRMCGERYIITYPNQPRPPQDMVCPICGSTSFTIKTDTGFTSSIGGRFNEN